MPYRPARQCRNAKRGCPGTTVDPSGYCPVCKPKYQWQKKTDYDRITGRKLQTIRNRFLRSNPLCAECLKNGVYTLATIRDHIVSLAEGGQDTEENTQALCIECHNKKTQEEARRGMKK